MSDEAAIYGLFRELHRPSPPTFAGFSLRAVHRPSSAVGGDFYTIRAHAVGRATVVIGDACGRGVDAARLLEHVGPSLDRLLGDESPPGALLTRLNATLATAFPDDAFVTAACVHLDATRGHMVVANAGHVPPVLRPRSGQSWPVAHVAGPPLGFLRDAIYAEHLVPLSAGDVVVLMTDGVLEAFERDLLNMPLLMGALDQPALGADELTRRILELAGPVFSGDGFARDDALLLTVWAGEMDGVDSGPAPGLVLPCVS